MTFEAWCREHRYHLFYTRTTEEIQQVTHNYHNGKLKLGYSKRIGWWHCRIDCIVLGYSLSMERGLTSFVNVGCGTTRRAAKRDLLDKITGATLYVQTRRGRIDSRPVPKGLT
jgi:hypothetical protein